jgi:hypothetical protein
MGGVVRFFTFWEGYGVPAFAYVDVKDSVSKYEATPFYSTSTKKFVFSPVFIFWLKPGSSLSADWATPIL